MEVLEVINHVIFFIAIVMHALLIELIGAKDFCQDLVQYSFLTKTHTYNFNNLLCKEILAEVL